MKKCAPWFSMRRSYLRWMVVATALSLGDMGRGFSWGQTPPAPAADHTQHGGEDNSAHNTTGSHGLGQFGSYPMNREASGTAWQPDSTPMPGFHFGTESTTFMVHGFANGVLARENGPRGDQDGFSTNMAMLIGRRSVGRNAFGFRVMLTAEPSMGAAGYPLMLQTGETADGVSPLLDRQHPHDTIMELAATWSRSFADGSALFAYVALAGEPPLGPAAFMHRASAADNPIAPITHHFLDSTHVTHGVVTVGLTTRDGIKIEGAAFNGREPDHKRWGLQRPRLDSFAGRISANPHPDWSMQFSAGNMKSPEQLHQGLDIMRMTASLSYNRRLANGNWATTFAWGRNKRRLPEIAATPAADPSSHVHVIDPNSGIVINSASVQRGIIAESAANFARWHTVFGRFENAAKDELFHPGDPRHAVTYSVQRTTAGYIFDLPFRSRVRFGIGVSGSLTSLPAELHPAYGSSPDAVSVFLRMKIAE